MVLMKISPDTTVMKAGWLRGGALFVAMLGGSAVASAAAADERAVPPRDRLGGPEVPMVQGLKGYSRPSAEHKVSFTSPGVISQIIVKDGDSVKKDQELAVQNEAEEKMKLEIAEFEAGDAADQYIKAADATLQKAKVDLERLEKLFAAEIQAGKSNTELDQARAELAVGQATLDLRKLEKVVKVKQAKLQKQKLDEKRLKSPVDGFVLKIEVREGEGADMSKTAVQVVANDPLWIEVDVPTARVKALKLGQPLQARYLDEEQWRQGKIIYMAPYADPRSATRRLRLEMPNPEKREAGVQMLVRLPDTVAGEKGRIQADAKGRE
jgi:cobalt-zinc-cadmium efflux system membrane fusion protein